MSNEPIKRVMAAALIIAAAGTVAWVGWGQDYWDSTHRPASTVAPRQVAVPEKYRDFLSQAEAAERIADPLARCLAFPDLPGNQWPKGNAKLVCEYAHASNINLARMAELVESGRAQELDALFAADLDRHFSDTGFSEIIHGDFDEIGSGETSDRVTAAWLKADPDSAFAIAARATYLENLAWDLRGSKVVAYTPADNFRRMRAPAEQAAKLFAQATRLKPRLLPAYASQISLGLLLSDPQLMADAYKSADRIDPDCASIISTVMMALSPKWGGSYEAMQSFAESIAPRAAKRPLLLNYRYSAENEAAHELLHEQKASEVISMLRPVVLKTPSATAMEELGGALRLDPDGDLYESMALLIEASRFSTSSSHANYDRGASLLFQARKPEWAIKYLKLALESLPEDGQFHLILGASYQAMKKYSEADHEYELAMKDPKQRANAMNELIVSRIAQHRLDDARKTSDAMIVEFPDYALGWSNRYCLLDLQHDPGAKDALRKYTEVADPNDPKTKEVMAKYAKALQQLKAERP